MKEVITHCVFRIGMLAKPKIDCTIDLAWRTVPVKTISPDIDRPRSR